MQNRGTFSVDRLWTLPIALTVALAVPMVAAAQGRTGQQIYQELCVACHGPGGEGTAEKYPHALTGKRSLEQLSLYIDKSMPEDAPEKLGAEDAKKVAAY